MDSENKRKRKPDDVIVNNGSVCCPCVHRECHDLVVDRARMNETYFDSLPMGYRFKPTDEELITHYLLKKIKNENLPKNKINVADIYGDCHPKDIVVNYPQAIEGEWYFFTSRTRKYVNGKRPSRKAGSGYWKATGPDKVIEHNKKEIGGKKSLVYHEGHSPKGIKTEWMMHEYVVKGYVRQRSNLQDMKLDDYVLCKIYTKKDNGKETNEEIVSGQQACVENVVTEARENVMAPDQQARVVSNQDINPTSLQVGNSNVIRSNQSSGSKARPTMNLQFANNVVVQNNYQNMGTFNDLLPPYSRLVQPVQRTGFPKLRAPPLVHDYSLTHFNNNYSFPKNSYLPPTPRKSAPLPPNIVYAPHDQMYWPGSSSNPPPLAFQESNDFIEESLLIGVNIENMFLQDGNDHLFDDNYPLAFDGNEKLDFDESKKQVAGAEPVSGHSPN